MSKTNVFIYGSCVSRDTFERFPAEHFQLLHYVARQSAISAYAKPVDIILPPDLESDFQSRMVRGDFQSDLRSQMNKWGSHIDLFVVDLIDERLGIYVLPDGSVVTRSIELIQSGAEHSLPAGSIHIPFGTEKHFEYWSAAIQSVGNMLLEAAPKAGVALLDIPWAEYTDDGQPSTASFGVTAHEANQIFPQYAAFAADALAAKLIRVPISQVSSSNSHPWGEAPFHYSDSVYREATTQLIGFDPQGPSENFEHESLSGNAEQVEKATGVETKSTPDSLNIRQSSPETSIDPESSALAANQLKAVNLGLHRLLPGQWHRHWIWQGGPASVHEFKHDGVIYAFDLVSDEDEIEVQFFPRDKEAFDSFTERLRVRQTPINRAITDRHRVSLLREQIPHKIVDDGFIKRIASSIESAREDLEDDPEQGSTVASREIVLPNGIPTLAREADYDYSQFGKCFGGSSGDLGPLSIDQDGLYRLGDQSAPIDLLVSNAEALHDERAGRTLLVVLGGLVGQRRQLKGPFFSGRETARLTGLPTVSISDPSLALGSDVSIGWYLGHKYRNTVPQEIAELMDVISERFGVEILLMGGSGGGFACLNIAQYMRRGVSGIVLNPQTSVSRYALGHVNDYLSAATGRPTKAETAEEAEQILNDLGLAHDITNGSWSKDDFLIAQNASDWHVQAHLEPLMINGQWHIHEDRAYVDRSRGLTVYTRNWGEGHANFPDRSTMAHLVRDYGANISSLDRAAALDHMLDYQLAPIQ
ncbi:DUF6270 domain-containing protein [Isoptericola sp. b408]|uniref:DUF6270 domain-containing protein n=1 Tax=Isoptericola sp. b408 TaxID=3064653 RepID=UPI0027123845|nr:DUF6270 domain-containing protein [Isoptericola sp. b408]MDO8152298.1 DUF6270 domain-containing protein [Isoptericola sp. b408]